MRDPAIGERPKAQKGTMNEPIFRKKERATLKAYGINSLLCESNVFQRNYDATGREMIRRLFYYAFSLS
jgi:hypothetical protein